MRELRDPNEWRRASQDLKALGRDYGAILIALTPLDIAYDLASLFAGRDLLSGHRLTNFETAAILLGFFTAGLGDDILSGGGRLLRSLDDADDVAARAGRGFSHLDEATALRLSRLDDFTAGDRALLRGDDLRRALGGFDDGGALGRWQDVTAAWREAGADLQDPAIRRLIREGKFPVKGGNAADDAARAARRASDVGDAASTEIRIIGFRGTGKDPAYLDEHPLISAGHVGVSFDEGKTIYGFWPGEAARAQFAELGEDLMYQLGKGVALRGQVYDDTSIFLRAKELASRGARTEAYEMSVVVSADEFVRMRATVLAQVENPSLSQAWYRFPERIGKEPLPMPLQCNNCATWPRTLGLPIPEDTGQLREYIPALKKLGRVWIP